MLTHLSSLVAVSKPGHHSRPSVAHLWNKQAARSAHVKFVHAAHKIRGFHALSPGHEENCNGQAEMAHMDQILARKLVQRHKKKFSNVRFRAAGDTVRAANRLNKHSFKNAGWKKAGLSSPEALGRNTSFDYSKVTNGEGEDIDIASNILHHLENRVLNKAASPVNNFGDDNADDIFD
eukprot:UC4_evm2s1136